MNTQTGQIGNVGLRAARWRVVYDIYRLAPLIVGKSVLVLGQLPFSIRPLVKLGAKLTRVTLVTDLAVEVVVEKHFATGWEVFSTFFGQSALQETAWDFVMAQGTTSNPRVLGQSASEILEMAGLTVCADEAILVISRGLAAQDPWQLQGFSTGRVEETYFPAGISEFVAGKIPV